MEITCPTMLASALALALALVDILNIEDLNGQYLNKHLKCKTLGCAVCHKKSTHFLVPEKSLILSVQL